MASNCLSKHSPNTIQGMRAGCCESAAGAHLAVLQAGLHVLRLSPCGSQLL